jgi:subtilase family serine protease
LIGCDKRRERFPGEKHSFDADGIAVAGDYTEKNDDSGPVSSGKILMFHWLKARLSRNHRKGAIQRIRRNLHVEELEDRTLLSTSTLPPPFAPSAIRHAYGFDQIAAFTSATDKNYYNETAGLGQTIAIIDSYFDPTIVSDLATFSSAYGLPQMDGKNGNPMFTQQDLSNHTLSPANDDWTIETALDVEWAHAIAPQANILLVEAASDNVNSAGAPMDLLNAVNVARNTPGVEAISMSWGRSEWSKEVNYDSYFQTPAGHIGITFVAASGDNGAPPIWPAISTNVVSVGGTTLALNASTGAISSETAWGAGSRSYWYGGSGGGFSQYEPKPSYQSSVTQSGVHRTGPDLAFDADPNTGYIVLDQAAGGWYQVGGTSAGAPQVAAMIVLADQLRGSAGSLDGASQTLPALYSISKADFHDITIGNNGYPAGPGYDLVTGRGSPVANLLVVDLANTGLTASTVARTTSTPSKSGGNTSPAIHAGIVHESVATCLWETWACDALISTSWLDHEGHRGLRMQNSVSSERR